MKLYTQIIDANMNRVCEGLRVLEDLARYDGSHFSCAKKLRTMRHQVRKSIDDVALINSRNTRKDTGLINTKADQLDQKTDLKSLKVANIKRVQEGLRSIEEMAKVIGLYSVSKTIESLRYEAYGLEGLLMKQSLDSSAIYLILNSDLSRGRSHLEVAKEALEAGVRIIQYREKAMDKGQQLENCKSLLALVEEYHGQLIINDHLDIALAIGAHGVHLGQEDMSVKDVLKIAPQMIVGCSTHTLDQALEAQAHGADYIGVGPIYKTTTKKDVVASDGLTFLKAVSETIKIPYVAIGGIKARHVKTITAYGSKVAMISEIVGAEDITQKINEIQGEIKHG